MDKWKLSIFNFGLLFQTSSKRLTNPHYADDILVYTKSLNEAMVIMKVLVEELATLGLSLNENKTQILRGLIEYDRFDVSFVPIAFVIVEILDVESALNILASNSF